MTMLTLSSTVGYWRQKCVDIKLAIAYDIFDIPGIILGAILTTILPLYILEIFCGVSICLLAALVIFKKQNQVEIQSSEIIDKEKTYQCNSASNTNIQDYSLRKS